MRGKCKSLYVCMCIGAGPKRKKKGKTVPRRLSLSSSRGIYTWTAGVAFRARVSGVVCVCVCV